MISQYRLYASIYSDKLSYSAQSHLGWNVDVWNVLVLGEERKVEENGEWRGVGGQDDDLGNTSVEGLGGLVGALLQLAVVR